LVDFDWDVCVRVVVLVLVDYLFGVLYWYVALGLFDEDYGCYDY